MEGAEGFSGSRRWAVLAVASALIFVVYVMQYQVSALAYILVPLYGIGASQLSGLMFAPMLLAAVFGIPLGALADRFDVRVVVGVCLVVSAAGAVLRMAATSYEMLVVVSAVMGFAPAALNANVLKLLGAWFGGRSSMAIGIYYAASGLGASAAMLSALLVDDVVVAFGAAAVALAVMLLLWCAVVRNAPGQETGCGGDVACASNAQVAVDGHGGAAAPLAAPLRMALLGGCAKAGSAANCLGVAARHRVVWYIALLTGLGLAAKTAYLGFLPQALALAVSPQEAGFLASFVTYGGVAGCALGPVIGMRSRRPKVFVVTCALLSAALIVLTSLMAQQPSMLLLFSAGMLSSVTAPIVEAIPCTLPELRGCVGSAGGIIGSVSLALSFFVPLVITFVAADNYVLIVGLTSVCFVVSAPLLAMLPLHKPSV